MGRLRKKRNHKGIRDIKRQKRTRAYKKGLDQIQEIMSKDELIHGMLEWWLINAMNDWLM